MPRLTININENVIVRLTKLGREIALHPEAYPITWLGPEHGYLCLIQLWKLMNVYGPAIGGVGMGNIMFEKNSVEIPTPEEETDYYRKAKAQTIRRPL